MLDETEDRDVATSCMIAMAKIGTDHADFRLVDVFAPRLARANQEVRETAALAIGLSAIAGDRELDLLAGLALDEAIGRKACGGEVDVRTRAFALYGLGLTAHDVDNPSVKQRAFEVLRKALADRSIAQRDVAVAAVTGLGLLHLDATDPVQSQLRGEVLAVLERFYLEPLGPADQLVQSHCPTAIARLVGRDEPIAAHYRELFALDLAGKGPTKRSADDIGRSCALALGRLVRPYDDKNAAQCPDGVFSQQLLGAFQHAKDRQTRFFALIALGQIGGELNRAALLSAFDEAKSQKETERTWCALALGVLANRGDAPDAMVVNTLGDAFEVAKTPQATASLGVALGLAKATDRGDLVRKRMLEMRAQADVAGYLAIGLALMPDRRAVEDLRGLLPKATRMPQLLTQVAVALGKLGDRGVTEELQRILVDGETNLAKLSAVASALGFIGDRRTIKPLVAMMGDSSLHPLARAFAAAALGGVADRHPLPWNAKIGIDCNYRAAVETLTGTATGVLDIL